MRFAITMDVNFRMVVRFTDHVCRQHCRDASEYQCPFYDVVDGLIARQAITPCSACQAMRAEPVDVGVTDAVLVWIAYWNPKAHKQ